MRRKINNKNRVRFEISQGCKKYSFDTFLQLSNAFLIDRYLNTSAMFHLVVVELVDTEQGTIKEPITTIFEWIGVKEFFSKEFYTSDILHL